MPIAEIAGPIPASLRDDEFLRRHVRQFLWTEAADDENEGSEPTIRAGTITLRRVRDGLAAHKPLVLAQLDGEKISSHGVGSALDAAWLDYMKDRPLVARGYLENEHGNWMRGRRDQMIAEDDETRRQARLEILRPPGR
jgi:hypothetical protein